MPQLNPVQEYLNGVGQGGGETPSCLSSSVNFFIMCRISTETVFQNYVTLPGLRPAALATPVGIENDL